MYSAQQRVEFFQSESDFGSETSLNHSRFYDFTNDIIAETDNLFLTLKKELLPNEQLSSQDKVKYALSRAQILYKDTIPEHLTYLNKISAPNNAKTQIMACSQKLNKLLCDYDNLRNKTMIYKQFFNIYGKEFGYSPQGSFVKGERVLCVEDENDAVLKPECIQINYNNSNAKLRATPRVFMAANPPSSDKEVTGLKEQVYFLKKSIEEMKKKYDVEISNQKLLTQKRIRTYLKATSFSDKDLELLKNEVEQYSFKLSCSQQENKSLKEGVQTHKKTIQNLQAENESFKNQIEMLRKRDINIEEEDVHDRSYTSDVNEKEDRKTEKKLKILIHQNELLKSQLKAERQKFYRVSSDLTNEEKGELQRLKKQVEKKNIELQQLYSNLDKQRIEILQISHNSKSLTKMNESLKLESQQLKKQVKTVHREPTVNLYPLPSAHDIQSSMVQSRKLQVSEYEGEGIEGLPYYQILNKEFKIRFRRSCLKDKELLHKANGLQIGVISQFQKPNKIEMLLHLTNYGEVCFKKIKGKLLNANDNKIEKQTFQYPDVPPGDQIKIPVSLVINNYPLGPLILALEYQTDKRQEHRILLPAHIFKMMEFEERSQPLKHPEKISISTERKVCKNVEDLRSYLKVGRVEDGCLKLSAFHRHTHTEVHLNIIQNKEGVQLQYNHYEGNSNISEYFIRTLAFLLRK